MNKKDITSIEDIQLLVDTFYGRVQEDELIGPIFNEVLEGRWGEHLKKMYTFWQTILLEERTYFGSPFPPHAFLPIGASHFERWLGLWKQTVSEFFEGEIAREAIWRGEKMAEMFQYKIAYIQSGDSKPLY